MEPKSYNIEELRCNAFARAGKHFDLVRHEDFMAQTHGFAFPHRHNYYMLLLVTKGQGRQLIDFESYEVRPQRFFLMSPGMIHAWEEDQGLKGYVLFFTADFFTQRYNLNKLFDFPFFSSSYEQPYVDLCPDQHAPMVALFEQMLGVYEASRPGMLSMLRSYLNILLIRAQQAYPEKYAGQQEAAPRNLLQQFEQLVDRHYHEKRMVKDYAQLLHVTPNYLNAICREKTGQSAGQLIRYRVMLEAKRMLAHESKTVGEIGHDLNFKDTAYFCRFFKKYESATPEQFRKSLFDGRA
ncbi:helix-turn-helix domain-containing protein [Phaeodactylibacter luteus]|uniref:Helix-turn-helix domain-containing protein n=1 Tax=Phaeodactylibacter luteus TaxID=1564516 RepID=A0A5C6RR20_9BACT|nr:helix-turn-helix domain-containing protein [Phaeodactylibacter luteus]TXB64130.1 helix-turn-helix domain-containing protein [Phaeodactylibacter luteus]